MASLGLKIYYLRTREKKLNQKQVAEALGIRQGTLSYIENDVTSPQVALLLGLSQYFDITPTFLVDDRRGVVPRPTERWGLRDKLVTMGMWIEVSRDAVDDLGGGRCLCPLEPGGRFYDEESVAVRRRYVRKAACDTALSKLAEDAAKQDRELERELQREQRRHPRKRGR